MNGIHLSLHKGFKLDSGTFSELKVMQSAAGYYIGREFHEEGSNFTEPGSRESGYFRTRDEAANALSANIFEFRAAMENMSAYEEVYGSALNFETGVYDADAETQT